MTTVVLVMAKAPVPGQAKTRLGAVVGHRTAAELAAAALLDTLDVCERAYPDPRDRHVALAGDLALAADGPELRERLAGWTVRAQRGDGFADRLAHAHADVARAAGVPVVQIGMDTPHLTRAALLEVAGLVGVDHDAVLGPAEDGGWWVLAVTEARFAVALREVRMSTQRTCEDTVAALRGAGARVAVAGATLRDVDTAADATLAAAAAPATRFARRWARLDPAGTGGSEVTGSRRSGDRR